uniref:A disintegrin and metalloproteinase with thrombospondin motifs 17-like n=1 Tax=Myxine glutinosa TaxID=7769 RepID=UPI00358E6071
MSKRTKCGLRWKIWIAILLCTSFSRKVGSNELKEEEEVVTPLLLTDPDTLSVKIFTNPHLYPGFPGAGHANRSTLSRAKDVRREATARTAPKVNSSVPDISVHSSTDTRSKRLNHSKLHLDYGKELCLMISPFGKTLELFITPMAYHHGQNPIWIVVESSAPRTAQDRYLHTKVTNSNGLHSIRNNEETNEVTGHDQKQNETFLDEPKDVQALRTLARVLASKEVLCKHKVHTAGCHGVYSGHIRGIDHSLVVILFCDELLGIIQLGSEQLFIEPLPKDFRPFPWNGAHKVSRRLGCIPTATFQLQLDKEAGSQVKSPGKVRSRTRRYLHPALAAHRLAPSKYCKIIAGKMKTGQRNTEQAPRGRRNIIRAADNEYQVNVLVVADSDVVDQHGADGTRDLIVNTMTRVYRMFRHPSLGVSLHVRLSKIVLLHERPASLYVGHNGERILESFCHWQQQEVENGIGYNYLSRHVDVFPGSYHTAVFITGMDFCVHSEEPCDTVGIAYLGGLCSRWRKCVLSEARGRDLAFTIAHELGHNMGMGHDNDNSVCGMGPNIMAGEWISGRNNTQVGWSACSRLDLQHFIRAVGSACMVSGDASPPEVEVTHYPQQANNIQQAEGCTGCENATTWPQRPHSNWLHPWWRTPSRSGQPPQTPRHDPSLPQPRDCGSQALPNQDRAGYQPESPRISHPAPVNDLGKNYQESSLDGEFVHTTADGNKESTVKSVGPQMEIWSAWSPWSSCSQSCGPGLHFRYRWCNNPVWPGVSDRSCNGTGIQHGVCTVAACSPGTPSWRDQQCQKHHQRNPPESQARRWLSVLRHDRPCALFCTNGSKDGAVQVAKTILDGTPCAFPKTDVCYHGLCQIVGCDGIVGSSAKEDRCGTCGGEGLWCKVVKGIFNHDRSSASSHCKKVSICSLSKARLPTKCYFCYVEALVIPATARRIRLVEDKPAHSFLAVKDQHKNFINDQWRVQHSGDYDVAGTMVHYSRRGMWEKLTAKGPITSPLHVMILLYHDHNLRLHYEYTLPMNSSWWLEQQEHSLRPHYMWTHVGWENCTTHCGGGEVRSILSCNRLINHTRSTVPDEDCAHVARPQVHRRLCSLHPCQCRWKLSEWSPCSRSCGKGEQRRSATCQLQLPSGDFVRTRDERCPQPRPTTVHGCQGRDCVTAWEATPWSQCSTHCGKGIRVRTVTCKNPLGICHSIGKHPKEIHCEDYSSCFEWRTGKWSKCSCSCGRGLQSRAVHCMHRISGRHGKGCASSLKPSSYMKCHQKPCDVTISAKKITSQRLATLSDTCTQDQWLVFCRLARKSNMCQDIRWYKRCCQSCRDFYNTASRIVPKPVVSLWDR